MTQTSMVALIIDSTSVNCNVQNPLRSIANFSILAHFKTNRFLVPLNDIIIKKKIEKIDYILR